METKQSGARHTPGPWEVYYFERSHEADECKGVGVRSKDSGETICNNETYYPHALDEKNAALIAAAPELLEALILSHDPEECAKGRTEEGESCFQCGVIAKAEGRNV